MAMMRKYQLNNFEPYQFADIRDRLEAMALQGWRLERMERYLLVYHRAEPRQVRYALAFHPDMGFLDPAPTPEGEVYQYYCQQAGWEPVTFWSDFPQIEIYCNDEPYPVPLQTDRSIQWRVMGDWLERRYVPRLQRGATAVGALVMLLLILTAILIPAAEDWRLRGLGLCLILLLVYVLAVLLVQAASAARWLERVRRAEEGNWEDEPTGRLSPTLLWLRRGLWVILVPILLYGVWFLFSYGGGAADLVRYVGQSVFLVLIWWWIDRAADRLRRHGRNKAANWVRFGFVLVFAFFLLILRGLIFYA